MGKYLSLMRNPLRNFNVESRAHKAIEREKPVSAPRHKSEQIAYERTMKGLSHIKTTPLRKGLMMCDLLQNIQRLMRKV